MTTNEKSAQFGEEVAKLAAEILAGNPASWRSVGLHIAANALTHFRVQWGEKYVLRLRLGEAEQAAATLRQTQDSQGVQIIPPRFDADFWRGLE